MIEQQQAHFEYDAPIVAPVIRIERQSLDYTARKAHHEYVLPLEPGWEVPRDNLNMGEVIKLQFYCLMALLFHVIYRLRFWAWETLARS